MKSKNFLLCLCFFILIGYFIYSCGQNVKTGLIEHCVFWKFLKEVIIDFNIVNGVAFVMCDCVNVKSEITEPYQDLKKNYCTLCILENMAKALHPILENMAKALHPILENMAQA
jgi:hypothetical protein